MIWIQQHAELLFCLVGCMLVTVIPRVGPVMYLHAESLPDLLRHWLSFVPVAVMAALLGPDVSLRTQVCGIAEHLSQRNITSNDLSTA